MRRRKDKAEARKRGEKTGGKWNPPKRPSGGVQEHGDVMRAVRPSYSNSSEEFGSQEHSCVMDAILGRGNY